MSAPLKQVRIKQRTEKWMNNEIIAIIKERNVAYKNMKRDISNVDLARKYKALRNLVQRKVKRAKVEYFQDQIEENKHDSRKLWKNLMV